MKKRRDVIPVDAAMPGSQRVHPKQSNPYCLRSCLPDPRPERPAHAPAPPRPPRAPPADSVGAAAPPPTPPVTERATKACLRSSQHLTSSTAAPSRSAAPSVTAEQWQKRSALSPATRMKPKPRSAFHRATTPATRALLDCGRGAPAALCEGCSGPAAGGACRATAARG